MAHVKCSVMPHKKYSAISYRVKCVAVENERVFGDVFVTHQTQNEPVYPAGFNYPLIGQRKKRNLIYQTIDGPNLMELNRKVPVRRASELMGSKIRAPTKRSKSMGDRAALFNFNEGPQITTEVIKKPKTYPAPLASVAKPEMKLTSLVDQLLLDIYGLQAGDRGRSESDSTASSLRPRLQHEHLQKARLVLKSKSELHVLVITLREHINHTGGLLVRQLRRRDYLIAKRDKQCAIVTAHLQAHSAKRLEDTKMRFSLTPQPGESGFTQWLDAMKMVARLQGGIPPEFRKRLWLTLAERHLEQRGVDWKQAEKVCFNEWSNPDDEELGIQIVKDLHRTGCSLFCGAAGRDNQAVLRRVLLGFARWNKSVGYCQGLNVLAALVLQVMDRAESSAVKVMIYLIEGVLPEGYFADNLRGLSVDMAVFRDLLRARQPKLSKHLEALQNDAKDKATGSSYEPPLTNVFTMQWFLTLFCHCLPQEAVLRVWDLIFLEGDEVLLRTALAIWEGLSDRIMTVTSADEFYSIMGVLTREMLEFTDTNNLIKNIVSMGPLDGVTDLREKHRYNITPWARKLSDDEDSDTEEDERLAVAAAMFSMAQRLKKERIPATMGALQAMAPGSDRERLALDISTLKQQYARLRERQRQAHIILSAACARQSMVPTPTSQAMNHLLVGKNALVSAKNRPLSLPAAAASPKTKAASVNSPRSQSRKDRQGVTLHWKDTKRSKQRPGQSSDTPECGTTLMQSPQETAVSLTSPKRPSADSDSDSTSTELCDEPDRLSDVDSEEPTSTSDCYVMATDDERNPPLDGSPTLSGSESDRLPEVSEPEAEGAPKEKPTRVGDSGQRRTTERGGSDEAPGDDRREEASSSLSEISIAKITDQIRRLSAEDDNTAISLTLADVPIDKTATTVLAGMDNEKSPNLAERPFGETQSEAASEFIADETGAASQTTVSFDYRSFSGSNVFCGESEGSSYDKERPRASLGTKDGGVEDRQSGTARDEGTKEVAAESFREAFTEVAGDSFAADSRKKIGAASAEDKRSEILRPAADYDGLEGIGDAGDRYFEKSLNSHCEEREGGRGDEEMQFEKSFSSDYGKPTRTAGGKLSDMTLDANPDKSIVALETKADRFESLVADYDKLASTSNAETKRFEITSAAEYDDMMRRPDAEVNRVAKSFGMENELTTRTEERQTKHFDASFNLDYDKDKLTLSADANRFERSLVTESVSRQRGQEAEDERFESLLVANYDKSTRSPDPDVKRFEKPIITEHDRPARTLDAPDKSLELLLGTNYDKSIRTTDNEAQGYERSLNAAVEKNGRTPDTKDNGFESLLAGDYGKAKRTPDKEFMRFGKSFEKPLTTDFDVTTRIPEKEDDFFEKLGLSSKTSTRHVVDIEESRFDKFDVPNRSSSRAAGVEDNLLEKLDLPDKATGLKTNDVPVVLDIPSTKTPSGLTTDRTFYPKQYVMGHLPISPVNVDQKLNKVTSINYDVGNIGSQEPSTIPAVILEKVAFDERPVTLHGRTLSDLRSPKSPESSKSFSSGDTMGPDSKPSSVTMSPRTPRSESRDFLVDKSVTSSMSSDSKTLILPSLESDPIRESPRAGSKKASYDKSNPSTPISKDSLKNESDISPKLIVSSSSDSCSPSKVKSSERSFSSDLQSPISANSIKYTSNYNKRGQGNVSDSPADMTSPFYPIAHPNQKTPSPYNANRRRQSGESLETSPEQKSTSSKESAKFLGYQTKLDPSLQIVEAREIGGCSKISDIYIRPQFTLSKEELPIAQGSREKESTTYTSNDLYRKSRQFVDESSEDLSSEQDVLAQLPQEKLDKHFMNFAYRHKDRRNFERSSSSLERRFTELKSSVSTDEFGTTVAKKRSSDILEDMKHLEAKAFSEGSSDPSMLTKKTSYIWEDLKNLEARRQDTFSDSASTFSKRRLEVPDISITSANRKSYIVHPKIDIDESSDSILKSVACSNDVNNGDSDDGRESKLGVWTKVKPRKRGNNGRRSSDRALKIIQENSAILHKILACQAKKRLPDLEEISKEITISPINEEISKIFSPILEKMGLNEHEINEELARINFKDFDSVTTTSVSEFDAKINDELSKLSLIDDSEQIDHLDVDEIISHQYLDTREALIDRKINEELSKLLANYEEDSPPSVVNIDKGSSSQNVSDMEGLDLTSISTNVFSYKSSNDSIETRSEFGTGQEAGVVQEEKFPAYAGKVLHYTSPKYVQDLSPKSDIDIYRELAKLDKISSGHIFAHTKLEAPQKNLSPIPYAPHTSPYNEASPVTRYSTKAYDTSPLKTSYDPYRAFDFQSSLSPRKASTNSYSFDKPSSTSMDTSAFEYIEHKTASNTYDLPVKSPIMSKESLEFRVRYDNESPRQVNRDFLQANGRPTIHIDKSAPYYSNGSAKPITPTYITTEERCLDSAGASYLQYSTENSESFRRKYEALSPKEFVDQTRLEYDRSMSTLPPLESDHELGSYLPTRHKDYSVLSPSRRFGDQRMPFSVNHYASKLSPSAGDDAKRPVSHPEFPDKLNATKFDTSTKGTSCYKKSSLSLGNIGQSHKDPTESFETSASPKGQFSPFPVRNAARKPKELALKLGLYSPKGSDMGQLKRS